MAKYRLANVVYTILTFVTTVLGVTIDVYPTAGVEAGKSYTITYSPKDQPATFILRQGLSTNLDTVGTIGTATGGSFTWTVSRDLPNAPNYALEIQQQGSSPNYSGQFPLTGGSGQFSSASPARTPTPTPIPTSPSRTSPTPIPSISSTRGVAFTTLSDAQTIGTSSSAVASSPLPSSASSTQDNSRPELSDSKATSTAKVTNGTENTNSTSVPLGGTSTRGLSTGAKAGIGVGVSIAGLSLALGAFFLGMSVRKKSRSSVDIESGSERGKPELDGKTVYQEKVTPELYADVAPIQAQAQETGDTFKTVLEANELIGQPTHDVPAERTELNAEPLRMEMDTSEQQPRPQELHGSSTDDPVSPIFDGQHSGLARRDTYNDPRLVQNPWAQDDRQQPR